MYPGVLFYDGRNDKGWVGGVDTNDTAVSVVVVAAVSVVVVAVVVAVRLLLTVLPNGFFVYHLYCSILVRCTLVFCKSAMWADWDYFQKKEAGHFLSMFPCPDVTVVFYRNCFNPGTLVSKL